MAASIRRVEVPHEPGTWLDLRVLSYADREAARQARRIAALNDMRLIGGATEVRDDFRDAPGTPDVLLAFDHQTVLRRAIVAWSYPEPVTDETIADLDEVTARWATREALALNDRPDAERLARFCALDAYLDGIASAHPPDEWFLSQVCEAFTIPLVAGGAIDQPLAVALDVLELRAYADAKRRLAQAEKESDVRRDVWVDWVDKVQVQRMKDYRARLAGAA